MHWKDLSKRKLLPTTTSELCGNKTNLYGFASIYIILDFENINTWIEKGPSNNSNIRKTQH